MGDSLPHVFACRPSGIDWFTLSTSGAILVVITWLIVAVCQWVCGNDPETLLRSCAERNICYECKYDLRGITTTVCPECGTKTPRELLRCLETGEDIDATPGTHASRPPSSA